MSKKKIMTRPALQLARKGLRDTQAKLVFTNGCFDLIHPGHVRYLERAKELGDFLVVAVNADETVRELKGDTRPLTPLAERMEILAALESVDFVVSFHEPTPKEVIDEVVPDVLVKGGDWSPDKIVGKDTVEASGGRVYSLEFADGFSTSGIIERIVTKLGGPRGGEGPEGPNDLNDTEGSMGEAPGGPER